MLEVVLSGEATHTNFIVFGLTRPGLEPTIYRTRGEHANHYATDALLTFLLKSTDIVAMKDITDFKHEGERAKTSWFGIRIMCPSGATCLPADCCFSELALYKYN
jgi:hypothetical protein